MHHRTLFTRACAATAIALACATSAQAALINGGFETGDLSGWTTFGDQAYVGVDLGFSNSGDYAAFFGPETPAGIEQGMTLQANRSYVVSFWLSLSDSATPSDFSWSWNGAQQGSLSNTAGFGYAPFSGLVTTGSDGIASLRFEFTNPNSYWLLDDVSVSQVPEPSTALLASAALLALLAAGRRKTR